MRRSTKNQYNYTCSSRSSTGTYDVRMKEVLVIDFPLQAHSKLTSDWMDDTKRITSSHYQNVEKGMLPDMLDNSVKIHQ